MTASVFVSIVFDTDDPSSVEDVVAGITGIPAGAAINTNVTQQVSNASGIVDEDGAIVGTAPPPVTVEPQEPTDG